MNYFLLLVIIGLSYAVYYEHNETMDRSASDAQQISDLNAQISKLQDDNKKLAANLTSTMESLKEAQAASPAAQAQAPAIATTTTPVPQAGESSTGATASMSLGTISTLDGKTYQNCQVLKVEQDGVVINSSSGITKIPFVMMSPELQKKFTLAPAATH